MINDEIKTLLLNTDMPPNELDRTIENPFLLIQGLRRSEISITSERKLRSFVKKSIRIYKTQPKTNFTNQLLFECASKLISYSRAISAIKILLNIDTSYIHPTLFAELCRVSSITCSINHYKNASIKLAIDIEPFSFKNYITIKQIAHSQKKDTEDYLNELNIPQNSNYGKANICKTKIITQEYNHSPITPKTINNLNKSITEHIKTYTDKKINALKLYTIKNSYFFSRDHYLESSTKKNN